MLTIENIDKLNDYRLGEWFVRDMWTDPNHYIIQIEKKTGYWPIRGMEIGSLTINLSRQNTFEWRGHNAYTMSTGFIVKGLYFQTMVTLEDIMTLDHFVYYGINKHIYKMTIA